MGLWLTTKGQESMDLWWLGMAGRRKLVCVAVVHVTFPRVFERNTHSARIGAQITKAVRVHFKSACGWSSDIRVNLCRYHKCQCML